MANMTAREQLMLELINRARMDPVGEAARNGIALNEGLTAGTITTTPKQVLAGNDKLAVTSDNHSAWVIRNDIFKHGEDVGSPLFTGADPYDRIDASGYTWFAAGENIAIWSKITDATKAIYDEYKLLFVDAGIAGRGHRLNILTDYYREVGIGQAVGDYQGYNASMITQDFGAASTAPFITGVAYNDTVTNDNFFTVGEEVINLLVSATGNVTDTTGLGGGYELAFTGSGTKHLVFAVVGDDVKMGIVLGTSNLKVDLVNGKELWANATFVNENAVATELHALGVSAMNLTGYLHSEKLFGNSATNTLSGNSGNDVLRGGLGNDVLNGGANTDTADYSDKSTKVTISLDASGNGTASIGAEADTLTSIENLIGGSAGDSFAGVGNLANSFAGNAGNDNLKGGLGNDSLDGGANTDTADYSDKSTKVIVTLNASGNGTATIGAETDTLTSIENIIGGTFGDSFTGGSANNSFRGGLGNDTLVGGGGTDNGDYSDKTAKVTVVVDNSGNGSAVIGAETDKLTGFKNLVGGSAGDSFTGGSANNSFRGGLGNDTLVGGGGTDTADYSDKTAKVTVVFDNSGNGNAVIGAETDKLTAFKNLVGGSAGDSFTGGSAANAFNGNGGTDTLIGGLGNDTLTGGTGTDFFRFNTALGPTNIDTITDFSHVDDTIQLENAIMTALESSWTSGQFLGATSGHLATTTSQRIIYDKSNGTLWYDSNGSTGGAANVFQIAQLGTTTHPANLDYTDFAIV